MGRCLLPDSDGVARSTFQPKEWVPGTDDTGSMLLLTRCVADLTPYVSPLSARGSDHHSVRPVHSRASTSTNTFPQNPQNYPAFPGD